jgi:hypothetical protein
MIRKIAIVVFRFLRVGAAILLIWILSRILGVTPIFWSILRLATVLVVSAIGATKIIRYRDRVMAQTEIETKIRLRFKM